MAEGTGRGESLSIWFFVGLLPLLYGIVLLPYGIYEAMGHEAPTVLNNLHPTVWWGLLLLLFGLYYTIRFRPRRGPAQANVTTKEEREERLEER
jgi:hypothetical protein